MIITPKGAQKKILALEPRGQAVVLGAAGSGKTAMAMLHAEKLSNLAGQPKVLVVTYNRPLVEYIKSFQTTHRNITIKTFHQFAREYLLSRGCWGDILPDRLSGRSFEADANQKRNTDKQRLVENALREVQGQYPAKESTLSRPVQTFLDEIKFLEQFGVRSLEQYRDMERVGRAKAFISRENRHFFYEVYQKYLSLRSETDFLYDWDDIALHVVDELANDQTERKYAHIIVDEGQDFTPMMLQAVLGAMRGDGSFTYFGDIAQQIYGNALSWKESGIDVVKRRPLRFTINYRNPEEIILFAKDIAKHPKWEAKGAEYIDPDLGEGAVASGRKPWLCQFESREAETRQIVEWLRQAPKGDKVVIVKDWKDKKEILAALKNASLQAEEIRENNVTSLNKGGIYVTTFYSAKGLEFDYVYIPFLNEGEFPDQMLVERAKAESAESVEKLYADWLKLFYVAATRARKAVTMTWSGKLTALFPADSENYTSYSSGEAPAL